MEPPSSLNAGGFQKPNSIKARADQTSSSADGRLAGLSYSRLLALGGLDALALGGLQDLLIE
jgi:hypothetical protein